jgi:predicted phage-related endonuclease
MNPYTYLNPETWRQERHNGIGASDIPILLEKTNFMTSFELWEQKRDKTNREFSEDMQKLIDAGHDQEPITLYKFLQNHNYGDPGKVFDAHRHGTKFEGFHLFTEFHHPKYPFIFCHPDMIIKLGSKWINVEAKYVKHQGYEWNFDNLTEDGIPEKYYYQVQFQMMVTGIKKTIIIVNYQGSDFYEFEIEAFPECFPAMEKICKDFQKLVENKTPPMPGTFKDSLKLFPDRKGTVLSLTDEIEIQTLIQKDRYSEIKKKISYLKKVQDRIKGDVMSLMGDNNIMQTSDGEQIALYSQKDGDKFCSIKDVRKDTRLYNYCKKNKIIVDCVNSKFIF